MNYTEKYAFQMKCYKKYQLDWMAVRNIGVSDLLNLCRQIMVEATIDGDLDSDMNAAWDQTEQLLNDHGFGGEMYACFNEFVDCEYQDPSYMRHLLSDDDYAVWLSLQPLCEKENKK